MSLESIFAPFMGPIGKAALACLGVNLLPRGGRLDVATGIHVLAWLGFPAIHAPGSATAPVKRGLADGLPGTSIRDTWKPQD